MGEKMTQNQQLIESYIIETLNSDESFELADILEPIEPTTIDTDPFEISQGSLAEQAQEIKNEEPIELTDVVKGKDALFRCSGDTCTKVWKINMGKARPPSVCPECGAMVRLEKA